MKFGSWLHDCIVFLAVTGCYLLFSSCSMILYCWTCCRHSFVHGSRVGTRTTLQPHCWFVVSWRYIVCNVSLIKLDGYHYSNYSYTAWSQSACFLRTKLLWCIIGTISFLKFCLVFLELLYYSHVVTAKIKIKHVSYYPFILLVVLAFPPFSKVYAICK